MQVGKTLHFFILIKFISVFSEFEPEFDHIDSHFKCLLCVFIKKGRFRPGDREGYILKVMDELERACLEKLQSDILSPFVPSIDRTIFNNGDGNCKFNLILIVFSFQFINIVFYSE
jgi:hypothetical protein